MKALHLGYHYVRDVREGEAPGPNCPPERLRAQIEFLIDNRYEFLTCGEIAKRLINGLPLPPRHVTLSFDDGLIDHQTTVAPILRQYGVPATFFYITCALDGELSPVIGFQILIEILGAERLKREVLPEVFKGTPYLDLLNPMLYDATGKKIGEPIELRRIKWMFNHWPSQEFKRDCIALMFEEFVGKGTEEQYAKRWFMQEEELLILRRDGMEIGAHTHTHPPFDIAGCAEVSVECRESQEVLESVTGDYVTTFAWPFGGQFREEVVAKVSGYFNSAWNFYSGLTHMPQNVYGNLYNIPRLNEAVFDPSQF
jgi:peptidoglycan/xylan/chitin deacetylase (PgdA/CDA1 family)